ncbi:hypothetical protein MMC30_005362 [Trapelia coarctata]|nr:hypothetical protein [Trapelia coarctata]
MGLLRLLVAALALGLGCASNILKAQTGRLHRQCIDEDKSSQADSATSVSDLFGQENAMDTEDRAIVMETGAQNQETVEGRESTASEFTQLSCLYQAPKAKRDTCGMLEEKMFRAETETDAASENEASTTNLKELATQFDEKVNKINEVEHKLRQATARAGNESIALSTALELAKEHQNTIDDLRKRLDGKIKNTSALEKRYEALKKDLHTSIELTVQLTMLHKSDTDKVQTRLDAGLEELVVKNEQLVEAGDRIAELERQNEGLATIMYRDREASEYYVKRAEDLAGLLEGRPMGWEDQKLIEEKDGEIKYLEGHLDNMTIRNQELEKKLAKQQAQIGTEIPALMAKLEEKEQDLAIEIGRTEAFKHVNDLKIDALKGSQPDQVLNALKQEHQLLRRDNKHLVKKALEFAWSNKALDAAGETSSRQIDAMSVEHSEFKERIKSLEEDNEALKIDIDAENKSQLRIEELEETVESLKQEAEVANTRMEETVQEATRFAHLPAVTQDQVRLHMIDDQLRQTKEGLKALVQKTNEDQASLDELKGKKEELEQEITEFKNKEKQDILREPYEEWVREDMRKRVEDAEATVVELQKRLKARNEQIEEY